MEGLGVTVIRAPAHFTDAGTLAADGQHYTARRIVIATGSRPAVPPIPGLSEVPFLTNETLFANETLPSHLLIVGGGPIGLEMAQAHRRLGSKVTVIEAASSAASGLSNSATSIRRRRSRCSSPACRKPSAPPA